MYGYGYFTHQFMSESSGHFPVSLSTLGTIFVERVFVFRGMEMESRFTNAQLLSLILKRINKFTYARAQTVQILGGCCLTCCRYSSLALLRRWMSNLEFAKTKPRLLVP